MIFIFVVSILITLSFNHFVFSLLYCHTSLLKPASPDLREFLVKARRGAVRVMKIVIRSGE